MWQVIIRFRVQVPGGSPRKSPNFVGIFCFLMSGMGATDDERRISEGTTKDERRKDFGEDIARI